ncbi:MAG TPA: hypothetical protein VK886_12840 [Vicinamibacterales bacterium]|nr:hypothetical protein [Vicinamibacterales bacterium]
MALDTLCFGLFELDTRSGELRKSGRRIALAPQPAKLLGLLASHPGELVTRATSSRCTARLRAPSPKAWTPC